MSTDFKSESSSLAGPSRKRPRSEVSSEERKEARAHRNRIAAQNSRDRRKAQFAYLERRVAELEDENKRLRAGLPPADPQQDAKDRENQELRARIATLERGLEAVVKAFAVQGLPSSVPPTDVSPAVKSSETPPSYSAETPTPVLTPSSSTSISPPSSTGSPAPESLPISPAPSHASLDFSFTSSVSVGARVHSPPSTGGDHAGNSPSRVPAAGELKLYSPYIHDTEVDDTVSDLPMPPMDTVDDAAMETLFHEILYSHSRSPSPEPSDSGAGPIKTESIQAVDLLQTTGQTQGSQETQTSAGNSAAQVSVSSIEGVKSEGSSEEGAETKLSSLGMDLDHLSMMNGSGFGFGLDMDMLNESGLLEENATIESSSGGFTATWLDDYTSSLLESFVPPTQTTLESDSSATSPDVTASSWESLEASLSVGVGVF
ncbi:hypothetical protein L218DRAFT_943990 [Marasmius fiardii PR-910]|nr:hypothetical protein L218DRAFT_943990 [Marasmius fiardii PR-910]